MARSLVDDMSLLSGMFRFVEALTEIPPGTTEPILVAQADSARWAIEFLGLVAPGSGAAVYFGINPAVLAGLSAYAVDAQTGQWAWNTRQHGSLPMQPWYTIGYAGATAPAYLWCRQTIVLQ